MLAASPAEPTFRFEPAAYVQSARVTSAESLCLTASVPVHVIVDRVGTVSSAPEVGRAQYVSLPTPVFLHDAMTTGPEARVRMPRPTQLSADGDAVLSIEILTAAENTYVKMYGCDHQSPDASNIAYVRNRVANIAFADLGPGEDICMYVYRPAHVRVKLLGERDHRPEHVEPAAVVAVHRR